MKLVAAILLLYTFAMLCAPCADCDTYYCISTEAVAHSDHSHPESQELESDHCPPFCLCTCCGSSYGANDYGTRLCHISDSYQQEFPSGSLFLESDPCFNIWHPPRIC